MNSDYYKRTGSKVQTKDGRDAIAWKTKEDELAEEYVRKLLQAKYPELDITPNSDPFGAIDYFVARDGKHVGDIELKHRSHKRGRFPDVWLNDRKAFALQEAIDNGRQAVFIVMWTDVIGWIKASKALTAPTAIRGTTRIVKAHNDIADKVRLVPIDWFTIIGESPKV